MSKRIRYFFLFSLIALVVSCKKKTPEDIGLPLLPGEDILNAAFTDTATIITHTVRDDSLRTDFASPMLLGNANDPLFGISKSSIFTQFSLSKANPVFGTSPKLDSAVLSLVYNSEQYYGALSPQKFKVYEVSESLSVDSSYYSNRMLQYTTELGSAYITPKTNPAKDSVKVDTLKYPPHLRITLDKNFFQRFLEDTTFYGSNIDFQKFFKGIYVASSSGSPARQGAILYMNLTHTYSRITLYYHNKVDTTSYYFGISSSGCARFSHFEHDYSSATDIIAQLNSASTIPKQKSFVQPMDGLSSKITFPYIKNMFNKEKVIINKAELIIPVDPSSFAGADSIYSPVTRLVLNISDSLKYSNVPDDFFEGLDYFGGAYISSTKEYRFNIARYIQQVLNGKIENQVLYINCYNVRIGNNFYNTPRRSTANRVVLIGGDKALPNHMRLKITYTPLK